MKKNSPDEWFPIGTIRTPFKESDGTPIQPCKAHGVRGRVILEPEYTDALQDLDGFDRIWLLYRFHRSGKPSSLVTPYLDTTPRGLFSTRAPNRFNPIGLSVVRLVKITETGFEIEEVDMLDETPLLDIKPYIPAFDSYPDSQCGWLKSRDIANEAGMADNRFEDR